MTTDVMTTDFAPRPQRERERERERVRKTFNINAFYYTDLDYFLRIVDAWGLSKCIRGVHFA